MEQYQDINTIPFAAEHYPNVLNLLSCPMKTFPVFSRLIIPDLKMDGFFFNFQSLKIKTLSSLIYYRDVLLICIKRALSF